MKLITIALAAGTLGLAACGTTVAQAPAAPPVTRTVTPPPPASPAAPAAPAAPASSAPQTVPNVTDPWAVVSAYYGDVESGDYPQAWALLSSGAVTGQSYDQFKDGFSCTGDQQLSEQGESGDQVSFTLAATDSCTGVVQQFSGTDTVTGGKIVAAHITQTG
jgi:curli biogenesis system outer membrane secretion channel CsgG